MRIRKRLESSESARRMVSRNVIQNCPTSVLSLVRRLMDGDIMRVEFDMELERLRNIEAKCMMDHLFPGDEHDEHETAAVG